MSALKELIRAEGETLRPDPGAQARNLSGTRRLLSEGQSLPAAVAEGLPNPGVILGLSTAKMAVGAAFVLALAAGAWFRAASTDPAVESAVELAQVDSEAPSEAVRPMATASSASELANMALPGPVETPSESDELGKEGVHPTGLTQNIQGARKGEPETMNNRRSRVAKRRRSARSDAGGAKRDSGDARRVDFRKSAGGSRKQIQAEPGESTERMQPAAEFEAAADAGGRPGTPRVERPQASREESAGAMAHAMPSSNFDDELGLLSAAKQAFDSGQNRRARRLLRRHKRRFPQGAFRVEGDAMLTILACRASGDPSRRAELYLAHADRHPRDASLPRVRRACGTRGIGAAQR